MPLNQGLGPLPPGKPIQPITSIGSGAPASPAFPKMSPMGGAPQFAAMTPIDQDPGDMVLDRMRAMPINPKDTPSAPFENPPFDTPKSFAGWMKNFGDDVGHFVEGIPAMLKVAYTNGKWLSKNLDGVRDLYAHPEFLTHELGRLKTDVIKGIGDTYKDGFGEALYKHPFSVLMDATTVFDVLGGAVKTAGRTALTAAERAALRAGEEVAGSVGVKLLRLGDDIQRAPGRLFALPFEATGRAALKVPAIKSIAEGAALTPYGLARKDKMASFLMNERVQAFQKSEDLWKNSIPKQDWDEYWDLAIGHKPMELASKPHLAEHAQTWRKFNIHNEEWIKEMGIKSQAELDTASLKPLVDRLAQDGLISDPYRFEKGSIVYNQQALDAAKAWTEGANPHGLPTTTSYMPYITDRSANLLDLLEGMKNEGSNLNRVARFEKKGLGEGIIRNPTEIQARRTVQTAELRGMVNYISDTIQTSGKLVKAGEVAPAGHVFMDPILMRYIEKGLIPVHDAMILKYAEELQKGGSAYDAIKNAAQHVDSTMGDALLAEARSAAEDSKNWAVAIPKEDAYLIESQLRGVSGPLRFYDKMMNTWRSTVLRLMPRYYVNNLLGNSMLLLTGGHLPWSKTVADQKILPAEAVSASGLLSEQGYSSDFLSRVPGMGPQGVVTKVTDFLGKTDEIPRHLLVETKLREGMQNAAALGDAYTNALIAQHGMDGAVEFALKARQELLAMPSQQASLAKRVSLGVQEEKQLAKIDADMENIQRQMATERSLSNAGDLNKQVLEKIGQNASADEIHVLHKRAELGSTGGTSRLQDLQAQLEALGKQREGVAGNFPFTRSAGGVGEDVQKLLDMTARKQALAPAAAKVEGAVSEMERFLGNYGRLHPLEREWVRRAIPFWTFIRTMNKLLFQLPFIAPKKAFLWNQYARLMIDGANDDRLPSRFRNMIPIGGDKEGNVVFMRASGFNPFEAVQSTEMGGIRIPKLIDPSNNPFVKVLLETRGGYDTFTEKPFTEPTDFVALDGTVYRYDTKTNVLEPVVPQKPLIRSLLGQIPHVKAIQEMLDSFPGTREAANLGGAAGDVTRKDPEGNYLYDRSPLWAISKTMGFPISVSDPEKVKAQHELLVRGMIKRYMSAARRVDPDQREKLVHIINDLGSGAYDLREW